MDEAKAWDQQMVNDLLHAQHELMKYLTHPDRNGEDPQQQRWEMAKQAAPFFKAVAAAREAGLTVKADGNASMLTVHS